MRDKRRLPSKIFASEDKEQFLYILALLLILVIGSGAAVIGWYLYVFPSDSYSAEYMKEETPATNQEQDLSCEAEKGGTQDSTLTSSEGISKGDSSSQDEIQQEESLKGTEDIPLQNDEKEDVIAEIAEEQSELVKIFKAQQESETQPFEKHSNSFMNPRLIQNTQEVAVQDASLPKVSNQNHFLSSNAETEPKNEAIKPQAGKSVSGTALSFEKKHKVAFILDFTDQKGVSIETLKRLNIPLTLAIDPFDPGVKNIISKAKAAEFEILLDIPMEALNEKTSPGREALYTSMAPQEIENKIKKSLKAVTGYIGVKNHMGSKFTADSKAMKVLMEVLKREDLLFVDSLTTSKSLGKEIASKLGVPFATRNLFIEYKGDIKEIETQLKRLEKMAKSEQKTVVMGPAAPEIMASLKDWIAKNSDLSFVLIRDCIENVPLQNNPVKEEPSKNKNIASKKPLKAA
jgi:polysaccharide deacetylase 2 family uncharacterized protein YibQ